MSHCPKCNSRDLRRSQTRSRWERWRKEITGKRPYRCRVCQWRGWRRLGIGDDEATPLRSKAPDPPNLRGTLLARSEPRAVVDLKDLDRFGTTHDKDRD